MEPIEIKYNCPRCSNQWDYTEVPTEYQEAEGCPDCMHECDRCGTVVAHKYNEQEHCL